MSNLKVVKTEEANSVSKEIFEGMKKQMGMVPNVYAAIGNSGPALKATMAIQENLAEGEFDGKEQEVIALSVAEANQCGYCLSAHTAAGKMKGLSVDETVEIRNGEIADEKYKALSDLAKAITDKRGYPDQKLFDAFFEAGYNQAALSELIVLVSLNTITNYTNHIAQTEIDFPVAPNLEEA
ncbi:carboxymuconolactone decarboxylase family protein [Marivirga harenae]|uniref:carboxymuconolactone decarboxylase family protein n=1 Tax=Marivirga harenae TaxID=2010992 RepID=UPI0026E068C1|nr:carboxymuconolactone decarboxylase family protein [Marivirga harenae]WKV10553.1 carboxymuconolactone decarboxylase family protein [Marivirga harenae]|tara:strand:- start:513677 stop:514222 length:546 start_codon:yes stop_codon:yes gene_type:complete